MKKHLSFLLLLTLVGCATVPSDTQIQLESYEESFEFNHEFVTERELGESPVPNRSVNPKIPKGFRGKDIIGIVRATLIINPKGEPVHVLKCESNDRRFVEEYLTVIMRWHFTPVELKEGEFLAIETGLDFDCKNLQFHQIDWDQK